VLTLLWEALLELDDLTASTTSVMTLIAEFLEKMPNMECMHDGTDLACYIRRLWPFFRHNNYKVRHAVLRIITAAISAAASSSPWLRGVLGDALHLVFINLMLETRQDIADESMKVWAIDRIPWKHCDPNSKT
jgi:TATA-binding protein-associated factor